MSQGLFGGATSYEEQSLDDILEDVNRWLEYTRETQEFFRCSKSNAVQSGFWEKTGYNFKLLLELSSKYFNTIVHDLELVKGCIETDTITKREVTLLHKIGKKSVELNEEYGRTYHNDYFWQDYGNLDFAVVENMYANGRDFFVTLQDAGNAACRLEDYMANEQALNYSMNFNGNISDVQIQQGTIKSTQSKIINDTFDYECILDVLSKIQRSLENSDFHSEFGEYSEALSNKVSETIEMVHNQEEPSTIKTSLSSIKELAIGVTGSLIASGIVGLISQLPIWK